MAEVSIHTLNYNLVISNIAAFSYHQYLFVTLSIAKSLSLGVKLTIILMKNFKFRMMHLKQNRLVYTFVFQQCFVTNLIIRAFFFIYDKDALHYDKNLSFL